MKKYIAISFIIALVCLVSACEDLTPHPYSYIDQSKFPHTEAEMTAYLSGLYGCINSGAYSGGFGDVGPSSKIILNEATTDEFNCSWTDPEWPIFKYFRWQANTDFMYSNNYSVDLKAISKSIIGLYYLDHIENMSPELKTQYRGEMNTIIAMYAYSIYSMYGCFPIVTDVNTLLNPNSRYVPAVPAKDQMIKQIQAYAREGIKDLPARFAASDKNYGRVNAGTAQMILLKLAMHEKDWQQAADISKQIIDMQMPDHAIAFHLEQHYPDIFKVKGEGNPEIIFAATMDAITGPSNLWLTSVIPANYKDPHGYNLTGWGGYKVPWNMFQKFWDKTGKAPYTPIGDERLVCVSDSMTIDNHKNGTVRICFRDSIGKKGWEWAADGALPYKYLPDPQGTGQDQGNDVVVFRFADVLLMRAEALNHIQPLSGEAIDLVNQIRSRANTTTVNASDFKSEDELNSFILDERFRELFDEGVRRDDLIRNNLFLEKAKERGADFSDETRLLFPIPPLAVNQGIPQNPGY